MPEMTDKQLEAEHKKRLAALEKARKSGDGDALYDARLAVGETQALVNERFGAPPAQTIGS